MEHHALISQPLRRSLSYLLIIVLSALSVEMTNAQPDPETVLYYKRLDAISLEKTDSIALISHDFALNITVKKGMGALESLYRSGVYLTEKDKFVAAAILLRHGFALAIKHDNKDYQILIALGFSELFYRQMTMDSAFYYTDFAYRKAVTSGNHKYDQQIFNDFARIADLKGERYKAIEWYMKSAELWRQQQDTLRLAIVLGNIGSLHINLRNYDLAIDYLMQAVKLNQRKPSEVNENDLFINLGVAYQEKGQYVEAEKYYRKSLVLSKKLGNQYQLARVFLNLSNTKQKAGLYSGSQQFLDSSRMVCEKNGFLIGLLFCDINQGELLILQGEYARGLTYLKKADLRMTEYDIPEVKSELMRLLSLAYEHTGDLSRALIYHKDYIDLRDSVSGVETNRQILELQSRYESERNAREMDQLHQKAEKQASLKRSYAMGLLLVTTILLLISSWFYYYFRSSREKKLRAAKENETLHLRMELKDQELVSKAMLLAKLNEMLWQVSAEIRKLSPELSEVQSENMRKLINDLEHSLSNKAWQEFEVRFEKVHQNFYEKLQSQFPELTPTEIKICSLLKLNLNTKDIALLTNRSVGTIDNARSSIRKKMGLDNEANLTTFLLSL